MCRCTILALLAWTTLTAAVRADDFSPDPLRSSKDQWFGGTRGFYWGCNNTKDLAVRMETIAAASDRPVDMTFVPHDRDMAWIRLYKQYKGRIDGDFGKLAFGRPPLALRDSCDAKYTTAELALQLKSFAHWGDPYDQLWEPSAQTRTKYPAVGPIIPNDWTVLTTMPPTPAASVAASVAVDLKSDPPAGHEDPDEEEDDSDRQPPPPVWHGTILPATDGDFWLASAFARFQVKSGPKPTRVVVNKYGQTPCSNGWNWRGSSFERDLDHTLIIYGTRIDAVANLIAAEKLRQGIIDARGHTAVQIKPDSSVGDDDLRGHHLLLIGRPECSELIARLVTSLPVRFGPRSFVARGQAYASAQSAVIAAGPNPYDAARSIVCIAGMSPAATLRAAQALPGGAPAPLKLMAANRKSRDIVPPPRELTWEIN